MSSSDAELRIGGNIDDLKAATDKATAEVRKMADQMQSSLSSLNGMFKQLHGTFMAFTAALAGGAAFKGVINASNEWAGDSAKLAKTLGVTTEQASIMKVALTHIGVESDVMVSASQKLSKQVFSNAGAFETMGIKVKDSAGQYRPVIEIMGETNKKLLEIKNPVEQNIAGMQAYGKSWGEVKGILKLTADQMEWAAERAKQLNLIVGPEGANQARVYKEQMRDLNLVGKSLEVQFGQQLTPVFVRLGAWMGEEAPAMGGVFRTVLESIAFAAQSVWLALKDMGDGLGAIAAQAVALLHGDLEGFKAIGRARDEEAAKNEAAYERLKANFGKPMEAGKSKTPSGGGPTYDFKGEGEGNPAADKSRMSAWESQLAETKVFYQKTYDLREYSKSQEKEYWESILRNVSVSGQERIAITKKVADLELTVMKDKASRKKALDEEDLNEHEKIALDGLKNEEMLADRELQLGNISKSEMLNLQQQYEDRRFAIQQEAQAARITAMLGDPNMDPVALQKQLDQMALIQRTHAATREKIETAAAVETKNVWEQSLQPITQAFDKSITGMIQGTTTMKKALANLWQSILGEFVNMCVGMVAKWAGQELMKTTLSREYGAVRSTIEKVIGIQTVASQATASTETAAAKTAEAAIVVPAEAAEAAAGAASSVASIPYVGPELAAAAFAETYALCMSGIAGFAVGSWRVPDDAFTKIHKGEMIVPAQFAEAVRNGGLGGENDGVHVHLHAGAMLDTGSIQNFFTENSHVIAPALRRMARNFTSTRT